MIKLDKIRTAVHLGDYTPADPEWHELRTHGVTGTDAGAALGLSPFSSPYKLWAIKTGRISDDVPQNRAMRLGQLMEPVLLQMFKEEHPEFSVHEVGTYAHEDHPELIANPDAIATVGDELWIVEIKTARKHWDTVPEHYLAQTLHYADVFNADGIKIVAHAGGVYQEWDVPIDRQQLADNRKKVLSFWNDYVKEDLEPDWDGSDSTYEVVRELARPGDPEESVELGYLGVQLHNANQRFRLAKEQLNRLKSATLSQMGNAKFGMCSEGGTPELVAIKRQRGDGNPWLEVK